MTRSRPIKKEREDRARYLNTIIARWDPAGSRAYNLGRICSEAKYAGMEDELLRLMMKFQFCYAAWSRSILHCIAVIVVRTASLSVGPGGRAGGPLRVWFMVPVAWAAVYHHGV